MPIYSLHERQNSIKGSGEVDETLNGSARFAGFKYKLGASLGITVLSLYVAICCAAFGQEGESTKLLWVSRANKISPADVAGFDVVVVSATAKLPSARVPQSQLRLALFEPGGVLTAKQRDLAEAQGLVVIASVVRENEVKLDLSTDAAISFAARDLPGDLISKGFDGLVVSLAGLLEDQQSALLKEMRVAFPNVPLYVRNAPALAQTEGLNLGCYLEVPISEVAGTAAQLKATRWGRPPLVVALAGAEITPERSHEIAQTLQQAGATCVVTSEKLDGFTFAPLREKARKALILYGWDPREAEKALIPPTDTMTAELFQAPLEHLGLEAEYLDVGSGNLRSSPQGYGAVILDAELDIPTSRESDFMGMLLEFKAARVPILFVGGMPFKRADSIQALRDEFGLRGTLQEVPHARDAEIVSVDERLMNFEAPVVARNLAMMDMRAPEDAHVLVSQRCKDVDDLAVVWTPAFLCSWGGMWLDPHILMRGSQDNYFFLGDPYGILSELIAQGGSLPVLDSTTRDGMRIFYSHIDGDGFGSLTQFRGHPFCAEVVRDKILKAFPLPVTVSIVEAEIKGMAQGIDESWKPKLVDLAKSIFQLPNVRAASHSFAHPYQWDATDPNPGIYTEPFMTLKPDVPYRQVSVDREIRGSVDYINSELLPKDKKVELMLWSGNCRPGAEALRLVEDLGIYNMNGGQTIVSRLYPGIAGVAPRVMPWGDELQIHASNQNEFMYANGWNGPFFGGFADVVDTFERTESPRRLKPVNVYYHFYSATSLSSLRALEKVHRWCMAQPLHGVSALEYAQLAKDVRDARVFELGPQAWRICTGGHARTIRLSADLGRPDLGRSEGVTGWVTHQNSVYVHTDGRHVVNLVFRDGGDEPPKPGNTELRLVSSSAGLKFEEFGPWKIKFVVNPLVMTPVNVVFSGVPANSSCDLTVNDARSNLSADALGQLKFQIPPGAHIVLDAQRTRYALLQ
ncbi:MAG: hypothetical protein JNJ83_10750 [Verrucomicrobiaceae bacterium]|nr:hypothetical protein [Verrucomicrobiaceae bacterium]